MPGHDSCSGRLARPRRRWHDRPKTPCQCSAGLAEQLCAGAQNTSSRFCACALSAASDRPLTRGEEAWLFWIARVLPLRWGGFYVSGGCWAYRGWPGLIESDTALSAPLTAAQVSPPAASAETAREEQPQRSLRWRRAQVCPGLRPACLPCPLAGKRARPRSAAADASDHPFSEFAAVLILQLDTVLTLNV